MIADLPDKELLDIINQKLSLEANSNIGDLIHKQRMGFLTKEEELMLDALIDSNSKKMVERAEAIGVAMQRGLLSSHI